MSEAFGAQLAFEGQGLSLGVVGPQQGYCHDDMMTVMMAFLSLGKWWGWGMALGGGRTDLVSLCVLTDFLSWLSSDPG